MIEALQRAGLTKGEARVYLAITELGESTVGKIVDVSGVTKSIIYQILEKLIEKGLVSFSFKEKTKYFQAAPPDNLITYLEEQEETLNETKKEMRELIPQLLMKRATANSGQVTVYQGFKGLMTVYTKRFEKLKPGDEYVNIGLPPTQPAHHHAFWQKDHKEREKRKIKAKLLYNQHVTNDVLKNRNAFKGCDARRMPIDIETPSWVLIYKDTVVIAIPQGIKPIAIEIVNQEVADSFEQYFSWFWKKSKPF
jgi:DNA-binding MarR family transcriptional regulator